jgi:formylglycine-generating enzyme required for sulfatase activity
MSGFRLSALGFRGRRTLARVGVGVGVGALATVLVVWQVRRATAEGVPAVQPLYFSGTLDDGGVPVEGARDMTVRIYPAASGGTAVCTTSAPGTAVSGGRFRVALSDTCATAVHANPDLWIEAEVGGTVLPRTKIGAVPYALEADTASDSAGVLDARLAALEAGGPRPCPTGMVTVGDSCIDRYEASVWQNADCSGTRYGATTTDDYPGSFPDNGNYTIPVYACSLPAVVPSRMITWFQAQQACAASGKHLCTNEEWQAAAAGTYDPGSWPGAAGACGSTSPSSGKCNTCSTGPRNTGQAGSVAGGPNDCISMHGAEDMIGNLWEWVGSWSMEPGWNGSASTWNTVGGTTYGSDGYWHGGVASSAAYGSSGSNMVWDGAAGARLPAAALRGGYWDGGTGAGAFAVNLSNGPSSWHDAIGFRCCLGR